MKIADLFVDLGVTGSEKSIGAMSGMRKGMGELSSVSIEAKAAILGAMYALQRMFATSGQTGTNLNQFAHLVDTSTKTLQQYQWAAQQVGVSNQEMAGTFKSLQDSMTKALMGEGAPKGLARIAQLTQEFGEIDLLAYQKNPEKLIQRLQAYAQRETNTGLRNENIKGFGVAESVIAAMRQNAFRPDVFAKAPTYSGKEIQSLAKADAAWKNLGTTMEMAFGRFNAKHGEQLVANISKIVGAVIGLSNAFMKLAENAKLFDRLNDVFKGWQMIFELISKTLADIQKMKTPEEAIDYFTLNGEQARPLGAPREENLPAILLKSWMSKSGAEGDVKKFNPTEFMANFGTAGFAGRLFDALSGDSTTLRKIIFGNDPNLKPDSKGIAPTPPPGAMLPPAGTTNNVNVNVPQILNFNGDGTQSAQAADAQRKAAKDAFQSSSARGWGN